MKDFFTITLIGLGFALGSGEAFGQHWRPPAEGPNMTIVIVEATLDGEFLAIGDEIGALTPEGVLGGAEVITGDEPADGDQPADIVVFGDEEGANGFREDQPISIRFWDHVAERECEADIEILQGGDELIYEQDALGLINLSGERPTPLVIHIPDDFETIQAGIDEAENGDTIAVDAGVYDENIDFGGRNIVLIGDPDDPSQVVIDGGGRDAVVTFANDEGEGAILSGFTIRNGSQQFGGGIDVQGAAAPTLTHLIVRENIAAMWGGGIYCTGTSNPTITDCVIEQNEARRGGGIALFNSASSTLLRVTIRNNQALRNDQGYGDGGGLYVAGASTITLDHVAILDNSAESGGGGAYHSPRNNENYIYRNVTVAGNSAEWFGGVWFEGDEEEVGGSFEMTSTIISNNTNGELVWNSGDQESRATVTFSDIEGGRGQFFPGGDERIEWRANIDDDPLFVDAENGDYHLTFESPCIDAGDPEGEPDPDGTRTDMGAFYTRQDQHRIALNQGWNMISTVCQPREWDIVQVWREVVQRDHLILIKNQRGNFYGPRWNFHNIPPWDVRQGYMAKMSEDDELVVTGVQVPVDMPIPLGASWNMVAYFPEEMMDVREAFASIEDQLVIVKNDEGGFCIPSRNFSNMQPLRRGKGYQVNVSEACELVYPEAQLRINNYELIIAEPEHFQPLGRTGGNMSLLLDGKWKMEDGTFEISVFTESGLCVGAAAYSSSSSSSSPLLGLAVWADDPTTEEIDGAVEGEALTFRLWNGVEEISNFKFQISNPSSSSSSTSSLTFETDGFAEATIDLDSAAPIYPLSLILYPSFPNPFNSSTLIRFSTGPINRGATRLSVLDLSGREIVRLLDSKSEIGNRKSEIVWDAANQPSGIYLIRLEAAEGVRTEKVMLIR